MRAMQNKAGFTGWHARAFAGMLLGIAAGDAAWGQCEPVWTQRVDLPEHRRDAVMVFDSWRGVALMIGGYIGPNDPGVRYLWQWDGVKWTRLDEIGPTERLDLAELAYTEAFNAEETNAQILWDHAEMLEGAGRKSEARELYVQIAESKWGRAFHAVQNRARAKLQ